MAYNFKIERTTAPKAKPESEAKLGFGKIFTDHMFIMDYEEGKGWHDARIVPYQNLSLDPACMVFHYAQEMFEGLKAYRTPDGSVQLFRPDQNIDRMNRTNERLCIPQLDKNDVLDALRAIVKTGGLAGFNMCAEFIGEAPTLDTACDHILHFMELDPTGKHIALGGDLDGIDHMPEGFTGVQDYTKFADRLLQRGLDEHTVMDIFWNNAFGVMKKCCM